MSIEVAELSRSEGRALFAGAAMKELGIPGEEFLAGWDAGGYGEFPDEDYPAVTRGGDADPVRAVSA